MSGGHQGDLAKETSVFQVAVGDCAFGVVGGDEASLDFRGKQLVPQVAVAFSVKAHATHSGLSGIGGAQKFWALRDDLS